MTKISLEIVEAQAGDGPDHHAAAIRVRGLTTMPLDPTFRIDPIDEMLSADEEIDWPSGPRRPAGVIARDDGFELLLGPDVLDSPLLLPGTPVVVSVTGTSAMAEVIWPAIAARSNRQRRPVIVTEELRQAERVVSENRRRDAAAHLAAATARVAAAEQELSVSGSRRGARVSAQAQSPTNGGSGLGHLRAGPKLVARDGTPISGLAPGDETVPDSLRNGLGDGRVLSGLTLPLGSSQTASTLIRQDGKAFSPAPRTTGTALAAMPEAPEEMKPRIGRQVAAFVGGLTAAAVLMFGLLQFRVLQWQSGSGATLAATTPDIALASARTTGSLRAVLATGGISPRGRSAVSVGPAAALSLADNHLHGNDGTIRDQGEASFWLRHALSHALDQESMKWSLTQLGSIYAAPDGFEPDYAKARLLWEISGALGDPVALCFNASLYEYGLGVAKHKPLARALYERARNAGGCRNVEEAIARTR